MDDERGIPDPPRLPANAAPHEVFLAGVVYGFKIGRAVGHDEGFGEGVRAMRRAFTKILRGRSMNGE